MKKVYFSLAFILILICYFVSVDSHTDYSAQLDREPLVQTDSRKVDQSQQISRTPAQTRSSNRQRKILTYSEVEKIRAKERRQKYPRVDSRLLKFKKGDYLFNEQGYSLLDGVYAIAKKDVNPEDYNVYTEKFGHYIVYNESVKPAGALSVVASENGNVGIFTGILKLKLADMSYADLLPLSGAHEVTYRNTDINIIRVKFSSFEETMSAYNNLKADPNIKRVQVEVLETERVSR